MPFSRLWGSHPRVFQNSALAPALARAAALMIVSGALPQEAASQEMAWMIAETPVLSFGGESELYDVRGLARLSDGRFVVADRKQRVLVFDAEGDHLRTFGRRGSGLGEFRAIHRIQRLPNDTLLVFDWNNDSRLSYLTADDGFARFISSPSHRPPQFEGALADGTLVGTMFYRSGLYRQQPLHTKRRGGVGAGRNRAAAI